MISRLALVLLAVVSSAISVAQTPETPPNTPISGVLKGHLDKLRATGTLNLNLTIVKADGKTEEDQLVMSKPNMLRLETPTSITVANGKTIRKLDKKTLTYTESPITQEALKGILDTPTLWPWLAYFDTDFEKSITASKDGDSKDVAGKPGKEILVTRSGVPVTLLVDDGLGIVTSSSFESEINGEKHTVTVTAKDPKADANALTENDPLLSLPPAAKKAGGGTAKQHHR